MEICIDEMYLKPKKIFVTKKTNVNQINDTSSSNLAHVIEYDPKTKRSYW